MPWKQNPNDGSQTWDYVMRGETEKAIDHYLEHELTAPLANNLDRHQRLNYVVFAQVYDDPRVAAGLAADAERYTVLREEVRAVLRRPEWNNP
jgi:hypothetical protein